jgi:hypothetical protein
MHFQAVHTEFRICCSAGKAGPGEACLLNTSTGSAPGHLIWEIPKGERL